MALYSSGVADGIERSLTVLSDTLSTRVRPIGLRLERPNREAL